MIGIYTGQKGELNFEDDVIEMLNHSGWKDEILYEPTEDDLWNNFRRILNQRNRANLNNVDLSDNEFDKVKEVFSKYNNPVKVRALLEDEHITIERDRDSKDISHRGLPVYLNIFDKGEIGNGTSVYQIAHQVHFDTDAGYQSRRGDITLLINGLPVIHIELKAQGRPIQEALNQIQKYMQEGVFTGIMAFVQVFFAMTPDDVQYFANYGDFKNRNDEFVFNWANETGEKIKDWRTICDGTQRYSLLSIPEAHRLVSFFTKADRLKDTLLVTRYYQIYGVNRIVAVIKKHEWGIDSQACGMIWCTTGGGKTLTTFIAAQILVYLGLVDKVVFIVDRKDLDTQSLGEYNSFSPQTNDNDITKGLVEDTRSTHDLIIKLKNLNSHYVMTSIQKMSRIDIDVQNEQKSDLEKINKLRVLCIVDEAHRSQFGVMHERVKRTFPNAAFIGFTGTPVFSENENDPKDSRTVFGPILSQYTIANGIRDENVLGFDVRYISTYKDTELRKEVALRAAGATSYEDAKSNPEKWKKYKEFENKKMNSKYIEGDKECRGIEFYIPASHYDNDKHRNEVFNSIMEDWETISVGRDGTVFHAILTTNSIDEVISYYYLSKNRPDMKNINVTALFDFNCNTNSNTQKMLRKDKAIRDILGDYNAKFGTNYSRTPDGLDGFRRDVMARLAHKVPYTNIGNDADKRIDIIIVDDQLLTGFDSKYINALHVDKEILEATKSKIIQAMSRTNRVISKDEKPFGCIRFYRKPYTMRDNLTAALKLYCGSELEAASVIVLDADKNIELANSSFESIKKVFEVNNIADFVNLPTAQADRDKIRYEIEDLRRRVNALRLQSAIKAKKIDDDSLYWNEDDGRAKELAFDSDTYNILMKRYRDMIPRKSGGARQLKQGYNLNTHISYTEADRIDADYLDKHFKTMVVPVLINDESAEEVKQKTIEDFQSHFGHLSAKDQKYAKDIVNDVKTGSLKVDSEKSFYAYIKEYQEKNKIETLEVFAELYGLDKKELHELAERYPTEEQLQGELNTQFNRVKSSVNIDIAMLNLGVASSGKAKIEVAKALKKFILEEYPNL